MRCMDCKEYLCEKCYASHKTFKAMKHHRIVDIKDIISGKVSLSAEDENICKEHQEPYKYYCKDEKKAICQDCVILKECPTEHDRITLDKAVENQTRELKGLLKTTTGLLKKYEGAVRSTEIVAKELEIHSTLAKDALAKVKQDYIKHVEDIGKQFEAEVDKTKMNRINELGKRKDSLESTMKNIQKVNDDAAKLITSESKMAVLSSRTTQFTKQLLQSQPEAAGKTLGYVRFEPAPLTMPTIGKVVKNGSTAQRWKLIEQFSTGNFHEICGLVVNQDGDIGLTSDGNGVTIFTRSGKTKFAFKGCPAHVASVAMTTTNKYVIDGEEEMLKYNSQGNQISELKLYDMKDELSEPFCVAVDSNGKIIAGLADQTISIHDADGSLVSKFATRSQPYHLAATSNGEIICSILDTYLGQCTSVQLMDYSGGNVRVIQPPAEVQVWTPRFMCSRQGEIFVSNTGTGKPNGVYRYTSEGDYLGCVTTEVNNPRGIALSKDGTELFVADYHEDQVKIFHRP